MAKQTWNPGTAPTGVGGDTPYSANTKHQSNADELYAHCGADAEGNLPAAQPVNKGGTGGTTAEQARTNLGLNGNNNGNPDAAKAIGAMSADNLGSSQSFTSFLEGLQTRNAGSGSVQLTDPGTYGFGEWLSYLSVRHRGGYADGQYYGFALIDCEMQSSIPDVAIVKQNYNWNTTVYRLRTSANTTVDSNGFIKAASPIVQLYADKIELNGEAQLQDIIFEKLGTGDYLIQGSSGLAHEGWYVETPKDANGNVLFSVVYETLENGDISVKTYKKKFDLETASIVADLTQPVDINDGRWIDLRLQELPPAEVEVLDAPEQ